MQIHFLLDGAYSILHALFRDIPGDAGRKLEHWELLPQVCRASTHKMRVSIFGKLSGGASEEPTSNSQRCAVVCPVLGYCWSHTTGESFTSEPGCVPPLYMHMRR